MKAPPAFALIFLVAACSGQAEPLAVTNLTVMAPITGQDRTVAYLTFENRGNRPVTVQRVASPQFATVQMHVTVTDEGISRMQKLDSLSIGGNSKIEFSAGGRHLMLIGPRERLQAGDIVMLEFRFDRLAPLVVEARLQPRLPGGDR